VKTAAPTWHAGERAVQARAGAAEKMQALGPRVIRDYMPDQHRQFFEQLPFLVVAAQDRATRPWASIATGAPGFVFSPDPWNLHVDALPGAPVCEALVPGALVGLLGIELHTRRRNRMNGTVRAADEAGFAVHVDQSFGNCPQYIQARDWRVEPEAPGEARAEGAILSPEARALVRSADTFFIATAAPPSEAGLPNGGLDASHRGGRPGFVKVEEASGAARLTWPEFRGNSFFNTLGNIAANPRAGLLFVDFATGDLLSLTGDAEIVWDGPELAGFAKAQRLVTLRVAEGRFQPRAVALRWSGPEFAREIDGTGAW
jgi:predicted pyridoxine 5'-phosphate oxidase superfamily flavin-nucleotide-binding protein